MFSDCKVLFSQTLEAIDVDLERPWLVLDVGLYEFSFEAYVVL